MATDAEERVSKLRLEGTVLSVHRDDAGALVLLVEGAGGARVVERQPRNLLLLRLPGDWALSCAFIEPRDAIELVRFAIAPSGFSPLVPPVAADAQALRVEPTAATEIVVVRHKRVVVNFTNVGDLAALDLTDREARDAALRHQAALPKLLPPAHHAPAAGKGGAAAPPQQRPTFRAIAAAAGGEPASPPGRAARAGAVAAGAAPQGELRCSLAAGAAALPLAGVADANHFAAMDRYYDAVFGQKEAAHAQLRFLERALGTATRVLDVGAGTGLVAFALRANGVESTCVDASRTAQRAFDEKNRFVAAVEDPVASSGKGRPLPFFLADAASFALVRVDADGTERYVDFLAVLCLRTLALLPSVASVEAAVGNLALHTAAGGVCIVSVPNAAAVIARGAHQSERTCAIDKFALSMGASHALLPGTLAVVERVRVRAPDARPSAESLHPANRTAALADGVPRRETSYLCSAFHPKAQTEDGLFVTFTETTTELLLQAGTLETFFKRGGFAIEALYGSDAGVPFDPATSMWRVYVLRKRGAGADSAEE